MNKGIWQLLLVMTLSTGALTASASSDVGLVYDAQTQSPVPIPPSERGLQTAVAQPWFTVSNDDRVLEGAIFDPSGNLLFCDVTGRRVLRLTQDKQLSTVAALEAFSPGGLAYHPDGRLFIAALDLENGLGTIVALSSDEAQTQTIIAPEAGYLPNDLVFDANGGFYFSDFKGMATEPKGGTYYVASDLATIKPVLPNLALANGVALSADGQFLWVSEFGRNLLHRIELADPTTITPIGSAIAYRFIGPAPDSMRSDADGNLYVAIYGQGRILAFNKNGLPIGQILLPERDRGLNLRSTSMAIHPKTNDLYAVTSDETGAAIFHTKAFAHGLKPILSNQ